MTFSLDSFPWRASAPPSLRRLEGMVPDRGLRAELLAHHDDFGSATFGFVVPVSDTLRSFQYLLIFEGGFAPLRPDSLLGTMAVPLPDSTPSPLAPQYSGAMHGSRAGQGQMVAGGFVLISPLPRKWTITPSHHSADALLGGQDTSYFARGTLFWSMLAQFAFSLDNDPAQYVFVQWAPDTEGREGYCEFRYSIFRLGPRPTLVASTDYSCDV